MATNIPVPAAQAALSLLSLSSQSSSTPASVPAPTLGRFVHTPRSSASVVRPPAVGSPGTLGTTKRRPSATAQKRRMSDATRTGTPTLESALDASETTAAGKAKKGTIFKCETCSKVYRHPNCLVKHRWEHSPHWREASKFLLSKHQQVQMLEAAAILSHISPLKNGVGTSLPEDRSLWPAYLSGGLLSTPGSSAPPVPTAAPTTYREREASVSTSAMDDDENNTGESSAEDEHEDSGYGSSSAAAPPPVAVPGFRPNQSYTYGIATSVGGHEYTLSSSHAACDAGAHIGSIALPPPNAFSRSISASSFGVSSLRGRDDEEDESGEAEQDRKWDEDESMAMDMDL